MLLNPYLGYVHMDVIFPSIAYILIIFKSLEFCMKDLNQDLLQIIINLFFILPKSTLLFIYHNMIPYRRTDRYGIFYSVFNRFVTIQTFTIIVPVFSPLNTPGKLIG